ncbi:branched-chain amino acid transport system II carrier protein [Lentilactobacillus sp. SPB1-3]|uniref:Branched-chain amino acid transport system II carrier protein n=1 Tax=Lentilactobacillus terminaliae TaxID=3003483 RepID=A0ACD5DEF0_9LACO|nr:branched-chain amino acid transport system II carrier protein [Lentilactobacillus sp. SPB1-3]MCZ0976286.1 branched-chain amino acid transport system II carrier protein [Lentilactobacillus sp. SPB1-3]
MNEQTKKLGFKNYIIIGSLLFGMFFGAGNLIFPIHLGQLAGSHWLAAGIGFLLTGTIMPLLAIIAISVTQSSGIYDLAKPISKRYATAFMLLVCATLGPLFAMPRTATVPFQMGFASHISESNQQLWLLVYSLIFFGITYWASRKPSNIMNTIGKFLNPIFLILLAIIFGFAFSRPIQGTNVVISAPGYTHGSFLNGFIQGYNTMDCIAGLLFGITVVAAVKGLGINKPKEVSLATLKSGVIGIGLEAVIYLGLIWLGSTSVSMYKISIDGGIAFNQIAAHYLGLAGQILLAIMTTLTCLTTAVGLAVSFSDALHKKFPKVSYRTFNMIAIGFSFAFANVGLDTIIAWSMPMLMFLYPLAITLIILSIASPLFKRDSRVYIWTTVFTIIPALLDAIKAAPDIISGSAFAKFVLQIDNFLPGSSVGMGWLLPATIGIIFGLVHYGANSLKSRGSELIVPESKND